MIRDLEKTVDGAGFPVVSWTERRGIASPAGAGDARTECRITKDAEGVLLFTVRGKTRMRPFEAGRPWERLTSFGFHQAAHHYRAAAEQARWDALRKRTTAGSALMGDGGMALLAEFRGDTYFDVSCPEASVADRDRLHRLLSSEFIDKRSTLVDATCVEIFRWPTGDDRVDSYDPMRAGLPDERPLPRWLDVGIWVLVAILIGAGAIMVAWLSGLL